MIAAARRVTSGVARGDRVAMDDAPAVRCRRPAASEAMAPGAKWSKPERALADLLHRSHRVGNVKWSAAVAAKRDEMGCAASIPSEIPRERANVRSAAARDARRQIVARLRHERPLVDGHARRFQVERNAAPRRVVRARPSTFFAE